MDHCQHALPHQHQHMLRLTYNLLINTPVLLSILSHAATKLLLRAFKTFIDVILVAGRGRVLGCVAGDGVHID